MNTTVQVIIALLPFVVLFAAFLILRWNAVRACLAAWALELIVVLAFYHMPVRQTVEASLWGMLAMWSGFLVLYSGQVFGQAYRSTGLLEILLESVQSIVPSWDQKGRAVVLVTAVGGFIGAFNGFATYPVNIPGLIELGFDGVASSTSYLIYFSWTNPFNSLFIAPTITNAASHVPVVDIVQVAGLLSIPLILLSLLGFLKALGFPFFERRSQILFWTAGMGNIVAIILFTQIWRGYYLVMMIAGAAFALGGLYLYGLAAKQQVVPVGVGAMVAGAAGPAGSFPAHARFRAYAPLLLGVVIVVLTRIHGVGAWLRHFDFTVAARQYGRVNIGILTSSGFFILLTSLVCYLFRHRAASVARDFKVATRRSVSPLSTLAAGSATVYLMVAGGQIALLGRVLASGGKMIYASCYPAVAFLGGMAFGQGLPGNFLLSQMQSRVAPLLGIPLVLLVGIVAVVTMGPPTPLKPTQIAYSASLANIEGKDGEIFRICLPWQLLQLAVAAIFAVILVLVWR